VSEALLVAAGGGGDEIAAAIIARALGLAPGDAIIATYAWERLMIDPLPGPRSPDDFTGLAALGKQNVEVLSTTSPRRPGTSTLPRVRAELGHRIALLDPRRGAKGLAEQLADLATLLDGSQAIYLVDVGGDILAQGCEPGLKSPLADALTLAASAHLNAPVRVLVAGPGLDGELTDTEVFTSLRTLRADKQLTLTSQDADPALNVLEWHPTDVTALLVAAARGLTGTVEIRDAGTRVLLDPTGGEVWSVSATDASGHSLAAALYDTTDFNEAEDILRNRLGWTELDYERKKATSTATAAGQRFEATPGLGDEVHEFRRTAAARGTDYLTFRRIVEAMHLSHAYAAVRDYIIRQDPDRYEPPLYRVQP
jgi:hypothetical protein